MSHINIVYSDSTATIELYFIRKIVEQAACFNQKILVIGNALGDIHKKCSCYTYFHQINSITTMNSVEFDMDQVIHSISLGMYDCVFFVHGLGLDDRLLSLDQCKIYASMPVLGDGDIDRLSNYDPPVDPLTHRISLVLTEDVGVVTEFVLDKDSREFSFCRCYSVELGDKNELYLCDFGYAESEANEAWDTIGIHPVHCSC